jgi:hypothetical protein
MVNKTKIRAVVRKKVLEQKSLEQKLPSPFDKEGEIKFLFQNLNVLEPSSFIHQVLSS